MSHCPLTPIALERPKLCTILAFLSAIGLIKPQSWYIKDVFLFLVLFQISSRAGCMFSIHVHVYRMEDLLVCYCDD